MLKKLVSFLVLLLLSVLTATAQSSVQRTELDRLDSIAFAALENGLPDTETKANRLLDKSILNHSLLHEINANTILGILNKNKGYYITSINHYFNALNAAEMRKDTGRISACFSNIGSVYQLQENYLKSLHYFRRSLELEEKLDNPLQKSIRLYNIGDVYRELDSLDLALNYFNQSLLIEERLQNQEGIMYALLGMADVYTSVERIADAEITIERVLSKRDTSQIELYLISLEVQSEIERLKGHFSKALTFLTQAENLAQNKGYRIRLPAIYLKQIQLHKTQKQWEIATRKYDTYNKLRNELNSIKVKNQLEDIGFQNALDRKEAEITTVKLQRDRAQKNEQFEKYIAEYKQKLIWFLLLTIVLLVFLFSMGIKRITRDS